MSLFRLPKLRGIASRVGHLRNPFIGRRSKGSVTERSHRRLALDPLEARQLLSMSPVGPSDHLVNESFVNDLGADYQVTNMDALPGQSVATDDDGDFVVTWARYDIVLDPTTGQPVIDPVTGVAMTDANIYARYFTDEVQRVTLPSDLATNHGTGQYGRFELTVGGNEVQKLTITSLSEPYLPEFMFSTITGSFSVGFDVNGNGSIGAGERFTMVYNEGTIQANENMMQAGLRGLGGALSDVVVDCPSAHEFNIYFGNQSGGLDQPEIFIDPALTTWTSGFYPAALISTVREPVTITTADGKGIPIHPTDPFQTASVIQQTFLYTMQNYAQSPTEFLWSGTSGNQQNYVSPIGGSYMEPETVRYADYRVSVVPVIDPATGTYSKTTFDITFIDESGKTNIPEMVVTKADDDLGVSFLGSSQLDVATIKEPSPEFRVNDPEPDNTYTPWPDKTDQTEPAVAMDADGDFVITWTSEVPGEVDELSLTDVYARRFSPVGWVENPAFVLDNGTEVQSVLPLGNAFRVNAVTNGRQDEPAIGIDPDGNFTIAWVSTAQDLSFFNHVSAQEFNRDGHRIGSEFIVYNPTGESDTSIHYDPYVAISDDGYLLVTWCETDDPTHLPPSDLGVSALNARLYSADMSKTVSWFISSSCWNPTADFDSANNFTIVYERRDDSDHVRVPNIIDSLGIFGRMYAVEETETGITSPVFTQLRSEFRANSSNLDTTTGVTNWSCDQVEPQVMLDADGDMTVIYEGFGPDTSDFTALMGMYWSETYAGSLINAQKNADLLAFFNPATAALMGPTADIDTSIEQYLVIAYNAGATPEQIGRLGGILNSVANLMRGEANGIFSSSYDADTNPTETQHLSGDCVVNAQRDGENARYLIYLDTRATTGDFRLNLMYGDGIPEPSPAGTSAGTGWLFQTPGGNSPGITVNVAYPNQVFNAGTTLTNMERAIQNALDGLYDGSNLSDSTWREPTQGLGTVEVRLVDNTPEWFDRAGTPWAWFDAPSYYVCYEVSFSGNAHDMVITMGLDANLMKIDGDTNAAAPIVTAYSFGNPGEQQSHASSAMQPDGDYVVAWTQWEDDSAGNAVAQNVYFREFNESTDTAGPQVTDFLTDDGYRLTDGGQVIDTMNYIIVTFDEKMCTTGTHSVMNLANWSLMKDGVQVSGGISKVLFGMSMSTTLGLNSVGSNKWEAVVFLDGNGVSAGTPALGGGNYQIKVSNAVYDAAVEANPLNSTGYNRQGESVTRSFSLVAPTGTETAVNPQPADNPVVLPASDDPNTVPNSPRSIAGDADGEYVVVWQEEGAGIRAQIRRTEWTGTAANRVSNTVTVRDLIVTSDSTAEYASVARDADGDFIVTWSQYDSVTGWDVYAIRYDAMGNEVGIDEVQSLSLYSTMPGVFTLQLDGMTTVEITWNNNITATAAAVQSALATLGVQATVEPRGTSDMTIRFTGADGYRNQNSISVASFNGGAVNPATQARIATETEGQTPQFRVNTETDLAQRYSTVTMDTDGDFVIAWQSEGQDGNGYGIYAQRYSRFGELIGGVDEIQIVRILGDITSATFTLDFDGQITLPISYSGNLAATAEDIRSKLALLGVTVDVELLNDTDIAVQFLGEHQRQDVPPLELNNASIAGDGDIEIVMAIEGVSSEFRVNDTVGGNQVFPSVAMDAQGSYVVSWTSFGQDGDAADESNIYAKRFGAGEEFVSPTQRLARLAERWNWTAPAGVEMVPLIVSDNDIELHVVSPGQGAEGVVEIYTAEGGQGTGTLLLDGYHILTAAHVVADDFGNLNTSNAYVIFWMSTGPVIIESSAIYIHPDYDGAPWSSGADLAIITLATRAPDTAPRWDIYREEDEVSQDFHKLGFGNWGENVQQHAGDDRMRHGWNTYDATGEMLAQVLGEHYSSDGLLYDFDGEGWDTFGTMLGIPDAGTGEPNEIMGAPGDSGGPNFIDGKIAGVTSYIILIGQTDPYPGLNSSLSDIGVDQRVSTYASWIDAMTEATPEFLVNTTVGGDQKWSSVAMDADGDYVITWTGYGQDGGSGVPGAGYLGENGVFGQRFTDGNIPVADEFQVNTYTADNQQHSQVAMDADGDFMVTWESFQDRPTWGTGPDSATSYGIYAQRFAGIDNLNGPYVGADGRVGNEIHVNTTITGDQRSPSVMLSHAGDAVIVWTGPGTGDPVGIYTQRFEVVADKAGPVVTDVLTANGTLEPVAPDAVVEQEIAQLVVRFGENLNTTYSTSGTNSILNPNNWSLARFGVTVTRAVKTVEFGLSKAYQLGLEATPSGKYEAVVTFDGDPNTAGVQTLGDGTYTLSLNANVQDLFGNRLDGDYDGTAGGNFSHVFAVQSAPILQNDIPVVGPVGTVNGRTYPETPNAIAVDGDGDHVIVWTATATVDGQQIDKVYGQRYDTNGAPKGSPFEITPTAVATLAAFKSDHQRHASVAMDADGDFVVTWTNYRDTDGNTANGYEEVDIYARRYRADGTAFADPFRVNTYTPDTQIWSDVAMDVDGDFVITWSSYGQEDNGQNGYGYGVYARRFDSFGAAMGAEFHVNVTKVGNQQFPTIAMDADGDFMIAWTSDQAVNGDDIIARAFKADGSPMPVENSIQYAGEPTQPMGQFGGEILVNTTTAGDQRYADVAMDMTGQHFIVAWSSSGQDTSGFGVYARRLTMNGVGYVAPEPGDPYEFRVNTTIAWNQMYPSVAMARDGSFIVTWSGYGTQPAEADVAEYGVFYQRYGANMSGSPGLLPVIGGETRANVDTTGRQWLSSVAMDANGNYFLAWTGVGESADTTSVYRFVGKSRFPEADTTGPIVTDVLSSADRTRLMQGASIEAAAGVQTMIVVFDENISTSGGTTGLESILNPNNWSLTRNGSEIMLGVSGITFSYNTATRKYEAVVTFDSNGMNTGTPALTPGDYTLTLRDSVTDGTNRLDGDYNAVPGTAPGSTGIQGFNFNFSVADSAQIGPEYRVNATTAGQQSASETLGLGMGLESSNRSVAVDHDGDFVVVWTSYGQDDTNDPAGGGVYMRMFDRNNQPLSDVDTLVNTYTKGHQRNAEVVMDPDGDFVVVWESEGQDLDGSWGVFGQRFNSMGQKVGTEFRINSEYMGDQTKPAIAMNNRGDFVVTYVSYHGQDLGYFQEILGQVFNHNGDPVGVEFQVNQQSIPLLQTVAYSYATANPAVAMDENGGFVITWDTFIGQADGILFESVIVARMFNSDGSPRSNEGRIDMSTISGEGRDTIADPEHRYLQNAVHVIGPSDIRKTARNPQIAMDGQGNFTIVWESWRDNDIDDDGDGAGDEQSPDNEDWPDSYGIYFHQFNADGTSRTASGNDPGHDYNANMVNTLPSPNYDPLFAGAQVNPSIALDVDGELAVTWNGLGAEPDPLYSAYYALTGNADPNGVWIRYFTSSAGPNIADQKSQQQRVNYTEGGSQQFSTIAMEPDGDHIVVWSGSGVGDPYGIYFRRYNETMDTAGPLATELRKADAERTQIDLGGQIIDSPQSIVVTFDEDLTRTGFNGVQNLANWSLVKNGVALAGGITSVTFGLNPATNKWEAVLTLDGNGVNAGTPALGGGQYEIRISNAIRDAAGNALGRTGYTPQGASMSLPFYVVPPTGTETTVNTQTTGDQVFLDPDAVDPSMVPNSPRSIAGDADGEHVIVWTSENPANPGIFAKLYGMTWTEKADGTRDDGTMTVVKEFRITANTTAEYASVARDGDGDFVVTWSQFDSVTGWDVWFQRFDAKGNALGNAEMANLPDLDNSESTASAQRYSTVAMDNDGDFVIAWQSQGQDGSGYGIYAQAYSRAGERLGGGNEIQTLTIDEGTTSATFQLQFDYLGTPGFSGDDKVTALITYNGDMEALAAQIKGQLEAFGIGLEVEVEALSETTIAIQFGGDYAQQNVVPLVLKNATDGVHINTASEGLTSEFRVNDTTDGNQVFPAVAMDAEGSFVVSWTSFGQDGDAANESNIYAKRYASSEIINRANSKISRVETPSSESDAEVSPRIITGGDDPDAIIVPTGIGYDGVVMVWAGEGMGTGSLLTTGNHILTAAHVVADDAGNPIPVGLISVTFVLPTGNVVIQAAAVDVHPMYNGNIMDGNDVAVITLAEAAPQEADRYDIYRGADEIGNTFHQVGYGRTGTGLTGEDDAFPTQIRRDGYNTYDAYGTFFVDLAPGILVYDFDDGTTARDTMGQNYGLNNTGIGVLETNSARGDSGGPCFIDGLIAGITSGGFIPTDLKFDLDITFGLDSSFGEFSIDTHISYYADWIDTITQATPEFRVNTIGVGDQKWSSVGVDLDGDFVITWTSHTQDGTLNGPGDGFIDQNGIRARRFDADGNPVGEEFQVNAYTAEDQQHSQIAMDADGDFMITWESYQEFPTAATSYGVYAQRFAATDKLGELFVGVDGRLGSEIHVNTTTAGDQRMPAVMLSHAGDAVIVWTGPGASGTDVFSQRFNVLADLAGPVVTDVLTIEAGTGARGAVRDTDDIQLETNQFVVIFGENLNTQYGASGAHSVLNPSNWQVIRNGETVLGAVKTVTFGLNAATGKYEAIVTLDGDPDAPGIQTLDDGDYTLVIKDTVWDLFDNPLDGNYDGAPGGDYQLSFVMLAAGSETRVNTDPDGKQTFMNEKLPIDETPNSPQSVATDADGDYGVVWVSDNPADPGIFVKLYNVEWTETEGGNRQSTVTEHQPINPVTGAVWMNNEIRVTDNPTATYASIAMDADGDFVVTWSQNDGTDAVPNWNVYARWYDAAGNPGMNELQTLRLKGISMDEGASGDIALSLDDVATGDVGLALPAYPDNPEIPAQWNAFLGNLEANAAAVQNALAAKGFDVEVSVGKVIANTEDDDPAKHTYDVLLAIRFVGADGGTNVEELVVDEQNWLVGTPRASVTTLQEGVPDAAFRVNTVTARAQRYSSVAMDHDGDFVITWQTDGQDGNGYEVYAQRYNRWAEPQDVQDEVQTISFMEAPEATFRIHFNGVTLPDWITFDSDLPNAAELTAAQIQAALTAAGAEVKVKAVNDVDIEIRFVGADGNQDQDQILVTNFVSPTGGGEITFGTLTEGRSGEFRVNQATEDDQKFASVAMDANGSFVVTWTSQGQDGDTVDETNVYARQYLYDPTSDSVTPGDAFLVNETTDGIQRWSDVAMDANGDFVITWTTVVVDPEGEDETVGVAGTQDVMAKRYRANLTPIIVDTGQVDPNTGAPIMRTLGEFRVNTYAPGTQQHSQVDLDAEGDFIITWESFQDVPGSSGDQPNSLGVYAQSYVSTDELTAAPQTAWAPGIGVNGEFETEVAVNGTKNGPQRLPGIALDDAGDVVIVWSGRGEVPGEEDDQGIFSRREDQEEDVAGPTVTDVHNVAFDKGLQPVEDKAVLLDKVSQFVVSFGENLDIEYDDLGAHSVLNPDLWRLTKNGDFVEGGIAHVEFGLNKAFELGLSDTPSTKYEAVLTFDLEALEPGDQPLDNGLYVLSLDDAVEDALFGNRLDGNVDGTPGFDFEHEFIIRVGEGGDDPVNPGTDTTITNGHTDPETPGAVAVDADGDYVVVWTAHSSAAGTDRVYCGLFDAEGNSRKQFEITGGLAAFAGNTQRYAAVAMDTDGDFIVTWTNYRAGNADVFVRRYDSAGNAQGDPIQVNTYTANAQKWSTVAMDNDGDFVVGWSSFGQEGGGNLGLGYGIYARRYDRFGYAYGPEFQVNTTTAGNQQFPSVAMDALGGFVFVWQSDQAASGDDIVARVFNRDGSPEGGPLVGEFLVNDVTQGNQRYPDVATNLSGDTYVVTWSSSQQTDDQSGYGVYTKTFNRLTTEEQYVRYAYDGLPIDFGEGQSIDVPIVVDQGFQIRDLNVRLTISHEDPSDLFVSLIAPDGTEILLFSEVPRQGDQDGSGTSGPNGEHFDGTLLDDEADILITAWANGALPPFDDVYRPEEALTAFDGLNAVGTWILRIWDNDPPYDPDVNIFGVHDPDGGRLRDWSLEFTRDAAASPETLVNTTIEGNQLYSSVAMDHQGNFVVAWSGTGNQEGQEDVSQYGVFTQRFNAAAASQGDETRLNVTTDGMQWIPSIGMDGEGNFVAVWTGDNEKTGGTDVYGYVSANHGVQVDLDGPIVADVFAVDNGTSARKVLLEGGVVESGLKQMVVSFGEDLSVLQSVIGGNRTPALESILNPNNWVLERGGMEIHGGVSAISFGLNTQTGRYEAVITLDNNGISAGTAGLEAGDYVLTIRDLVEDTSGNALDGDYDGATGTVPGYSGHNGYKFEFHVASNGQVLGPEQRVNETTDPVQILSEPQGTGYAREVTTMSIAVDNDGDYVVVWTGYGMDGDDANETNVYARLYDRNNNALTGEFRVNKLTEGNQGNAAVAMDADGDFVVVWEGDSADGTLDVYAQRFDAKGNRIANTSDQRISEDPYDKVSGSVVIDGQTVLVSQIEMLVNTSTVGEQFNPAVAIDSYGNYVVVWGTAGQNFSYFNHVMAQRFDFRGEAMGDEFQVNTVGMPGANVPGTFTVNPSVDVNDEGLMVVTWDRITAQTSGVVTNTEVVARLFDAENNPMPDPEGDDDEEPIPMAEFVVNVGEIVGQDGTHIVVDNAVGGTDIWRAARNPQVGMDAAGNFIVVFEAYLDNDTELLDGPDSYGIYFRRYDAQGTPLTDEVQQANTVVTAVDEGPFVGTISADFGYDQVNPTVGVDADGDFAIFWNGNGAEPDRLDIANPELVSDQDTAGVFGRWFTGSMGAAVADPTSPQQRANKTEAGMQQFASIAMEPDGDAVVAWAGNGVGDRHGIFVRHYDQASDTAGPVATELRLSDGDHGLIGPGDNVYGSNPKTLWVVFDEQLNATAGGLHSVTNVNNWALIDGYGQEMAGAIQSVTFVLEPSINKWVAKVTFAGTPGLENGTYTLVARTGIHDLAGNPLARTGYQPYGTGRRYDELGNEIPLDPATSPTGGFGFQFTVNSTYPGNPTLHGLDQLVSTVPQVTYGEDDLGLIGYQDSSDVARNTNGDYVVVWVEYTEVISTVGMTVPADAVLAVIPAEPVLQANIWAQRFNNDGREQGEAILVNTFQPVVDMDLNGNPVVQPEPAVAIDGGGNFVVVWAGSSTQLGDTTGIYAQRFDADGNKLGGQFRVNQWIDNPQDEPAVAMNANNGDFVVTWTSSLQDGSKDGVCGRLYRADGLPYGNEFRVNTVTTGAQGDSDVTMNTQGNFVVAWTCEGEGSGTGIIAQRFNAAGTKLGGQILVNTYLSGSQLDPAVAMDLVGNFAVVWTSPQDGSGTGIYAQRFNAAGVKQGTEFLVNQTTIHDQTDPDIAMSASGIFTVVWTSFNQDTIPPQQYVRDLGVFARTYNANGTDYNHQYAGVVREFRVNAETEGDQYAPAIAMDANGHYVVTWSGQNTALTTFIENPDTTDGAPEFLEVPRAITAIYSRFIDPPVATATDATPVDVVISGTSGNDVFEFVGGPDPALWIVKLNGVVQTIAANAGTLRFDGKGGTDSVTFTGSSVNDVAELWATHGTFTSVDYTVVVENVESITATGGGGTDKAILHDSTGDDTFTGNPDSGVMTGSGFTLTAKAFETVQAKADGGGSDTANLYDSAGDDTFTVSPASATMVGGAYLIQADGFEYAKGTSSGGADVANLYDSAQVDTLVATPTYAKLSNTSGYYAQATGFRYVRAYSTAGGRDVASMSGSAGNDTFTASSTYAKFEGANFYNRADFFEVVNGDGSGGNDIAYLYDSKGDDTFVAGPQYGQMFGLGYNNRADFFYKVYGYCTAGGNDLASLHDSTGDDRLFVTQTYAQLTGGNFFNRAYGFDRVDARATSGGYDEATLYDSAMSDYLEAEAGWVRLSNPDAQNGFNYWATSFDHVTAQSTGGDDVKNIRNIDFALAMEGTWRDE